MTPEMLAYFNCKFLHAKNPYWDGSYIFSEEAKKHVPNIQWICKQCQKITIEKIEDGKNTDIRPERPS